MAIVIVINQESGMAIPTRKHSKKMSVKIVKQKKRYIYIYTWRQYGKAYKGLGFVSKIRSSP